jgi:type II secretory pathway component GspD/PulD (secretin)
MLKRIVTIAFTAIAMTSASFAAPTTAPADDSIVTRVYDISDLLWARNDYFAPAATMEMASEGNRPLFGGGAAPDGGNTISGPSRQDLADNIVKLIQDTISPETWKANGGNYGNLRELSGQLVVTQLPENHQRIQKVLEALRTDRGRMVVVRAYWLLLEPEAVPPISGQPGAKELPTIDDKLIDANHLYSAAQTMCFSGQTVHVTSGRTRSVVTDITPVVASNAVGYNPTLTSMRSGVVLQVTPHLEPEGPDARCDVDLQSDVTELGNIDSDKIKMPATTEPSSTLDAIDRVNAVRQELRTTVRLPLGKKVLVGGMTLEPAAKEEAAKQLYLVIQADALK